MASASFTGWLLACSLRPFSFQCERFELFGQEPLGFGLGTFVAQLAGMALSQARLHSLEQPGLELAAPQQPAPLERLAFPLVGFLGGAAPSAAQIAPVPQLLSFPIPCSPSKRSTRIQAGRCSGAARYQTKLLHG